MPTHKSEDYNLSAVEYYLTRRQNIGRSLLRWVDKYNAYT